MNQQAFSNQSTSHAPLSHIDTCTIIMAQEETTACSWLGGGTGLFLLRTLLSQDNEITDLAS